MVLGFNHNIMYRGEVFHVQTEDSGVEIPNIVTLLYKGGVILCSMKTSYADILKMDNLEDVVEELMKEQHKTMMRRLKSGEFDERAFPSGPAAATAEGPDQASREDGSPAPPSHSPPAAGDEAPREGAPPEPPQRPAAGDRQEPEGSRSLDDEILRFFGIHGT